MKNLKFSYYDSKAGKQNETFDKLSSLIKYIEDFEPDGESTGIIFQNEEPILKYSSNDDGFIFWEKYEV